jgi:hypothetical protein
MASHFTQRSKMNPRLILCLDQTRLLRSQLYFGIQMRNTYHVCALQITSKCIQTLVELSTDSFQTSVTNVTSF